MTGCDRISEGCDHCYALTQAARLQRMGVANYDKDGDPVTSCIVRPLAGEPVRAVPPTRTPKHAEAIVHAVDDALEAAGPTRCV